MKTARLLRWIGGLPRRGDFLRTKRGTLYAVHRCHPNTRPSARTIAVMEIERVDEVPSGAVVLVYHSGGWGSRPC